MGVLAKQAVIIFHTSGVGISLECLTDDRTGYIMFNVHQNDILIETRDHESKESNDRLKFGVELKQLVNSMRSITTLVDALEFEVNDDHFQVIAKTKKDVTTTKIASYEIKEELLEIPETMKIKHKQDYDTKVLELAIKEIINNSKNNSSIVKFPGVDSDQQFNGQNLLWMIKPTLFKKVHVTLYKNYPLKITYKLYKESSLNLYLAECTKL